MFKVPVTKRRVGDFEDRFEKGIWLGMTIRSQEDLIGTQDGVYRAGKVLRCAPDQRWYAEMVKAIKGTPDEPKPGVKSDMVPVYVKSQDNAKQKPDGKFEAPTSTPHIPVVRASNIYKGDVETHGPTPGCKACNAILIGSERRHPHSDECRLRFETIFQESEDPRIARMDQRIAMAIQRKEESDKKKRLEEEAQRALEVEMEAEHRGDADAAVPATESNMRDVQMTPEQASYATVPERAWAERLARKRRAEENEDDGSHAEANAQRVQMPNTASSSGGASSGSERGQKRQSDFPPR